MRFFYETFPIFLCGLASGIVLMVLVGHKGKRGGNSKRLSKRNHPPQIGNQEINGLQAELLPPAESGKNRNKFQWIKVKPQE